MVPIGNSLPILEDLVSFWATQQVVASFLRVLWVGDVWLLEVGFVGVLFVNTNHFTKQHQINCQKIQKMAVGCDDQIQSLSFCNFCSLKRCETFASFSLKKKKTQESVLQEEIPELDALMRGIRSDSGFPDELKLCLFGGQMHGFGHDKDGFTKTAPVWKSCRMNLFFVGIWCLLLRISPWKRFH